MSDNPNFVATFSTDEVYVAQDLNLCLTDELNDKAYINHEHNNLYANVNHMHDNYAVASDITALRDAIGDKANKEHVHSEYALNSHTHSNYATTNDVDILENEISAKANVNHAHDDYATIINLNEVSDNVNGKADIVHNHDDRYFTEGEINSKLSSNLASAKTYTDNVKNDLLNGAGAAYDTLKELGDLINDNVDAIDALETVASGKANAVHNHDDRYYTETEVNNKLSEKAGTLHTHTIANVTNLQLTLDSKASANHIHPIVSTTTDGLMSKDDKVKLNGIAVGANKYVLPSANGPTLGGVKTGGDCSIANGIITVNDDSHNHIVGNIDGLQTALNNKSDKSIQMTADNGDVKYSYYRDDGKNILTEIAGYPVGMYTVYSQSGTTGNPKSTEAWRLVVHKTNTNVGWVQAYGSIGSVYTNYIDGTNGWRGWKCIFDNDPEPLWTGKYYMHSPNSTPQTVNLKKNLSDCRTGVMLVWSDYDASTSTANDADFTTTFIPKRSPSGEKWGGKSFLCDIPRYVGDGNPTTEKRIIKPIYVHDNCIKGSYQNAEYDRADVVLRAVWEV